MSRVLTIGLVSVGVASCSISGKIRDLIGSGVKADIAIPGNVPEENEPEAVQSSVREHVEGEPIIMNAELDEDTGEMVAVMKPKLWQGSTMLAKGSDRFQSVSTSWCRLPSFLPICS